VRLAVTGTTGFLGRHLAAAALARGHEVRALVRPGRAAPEGAEGVAGDLADVGALARLVAGADVLFHLAALGVQSRDRDWGRLVEVNVARPLALVDAAARAEVGLMVAAGTVLEYRGHGRLPDAPAPLPAICGEDAPADPLDPYGATKAAGGALLRARAVEAGLPCWYLRLATMYGPGDDAQKLLPSAIAAARAGRPFETSGGEQVREWLHVEDAVEALLAAATAPPRAGAEVVNVGTGQGVALREVVGRVFDLAGADPALLRLGARPYRRGEVHRLVMSAERARARWPGRPATRTLEDGLVALVGPALH
jgi:nucleoside-diphosphate-sugar epimerase